MFKKLAICLAALGISSFANASNPKNFSDITVDTTVTENGIRKILPSTAPAGISIPIYISSDNAVHYYQAVTDPVREAGINTFTQLNTIENLPLMFEELSTSSTPASGKRGFYATSSGFYQINSAGVISQIGGGGWTQSGSVVSSSYTIVVGSVQATATAGHILEVNNGNTKLWEVTSASTTIKSAASMIMTGVSSMSLTNATFTIDDSVFDISGSTIVTPKFTSNPGFTDGMWANSSTEQIYIGTIAYTSASSGGGVGSSTSNPTGWLYFNEVNMTTAPVVIGSTSTVLPTDTIFRVTDEENPIWSIDPATTTIHSVASVNMTGVSTITFSGNLFSTSAKRVKASMTLPLIATNQNNYDLTGDYEVYRTSASTSVDITGLTNGASDRIVSVVNVGTTTITFKNDSGSSTDTNRFSMSGDVVAASKATTHFRYDGILQRWLEW